MQDIEVTAYRKLAAAVVGRAVLDSRGTDEAADEARAFLRGGPALDFWLDWLGDPTWLEARLHSRRRQRQAVRRAGRHRRAH